MNQLGYAKLRSAALVLWLLCALGLGNHRSHSAVALELSNSVNSGSGAITVVAFETFSVEVWVRGLTSSALHSFNLTLAPLPEGFMLNGYTDLLPSGWLSFPNVSNRQYGGYNWSTTDITGDAALVRLQLTAGASSGTIDFGSPGVFQNLLDGNDQAIAYVSSGLLVKVVPEPRLMSLLVGGLFLACAAKMGRSTNAPIHVPRANREPSECWVLDGGSVPQSAQTIPRRPRRRF